MYIKDEKLKELLLDSGMVTEKIFETAKAEAFRSGQSVTNVLIGREDITEDYLLELLAPYFGVQIVNLKQITIPSETLDLLPEVYVKNKGVVIFEYDKEKRTAKLAMINPLDLETINFIKFKTNCLWLDVYLTSQSSLAFVFKQYRKTIGVSFNQIIDESIKQSIALSGETDLSKMAEAIPIVSILDSVLENAVFMNASDIHF